MAKPQRSLRLEKRSARSLDTLSGSSGEIFYDADNDALRLYTDNSGERIILASRSWVEANTFSGSYADLTGAPTIPTDISQLSDTTDLLTPDLTGYATQAYVDSAVSGATGGAVDMNGLTDVDTAGVTDGQALLYDSASGTWLPQSLGAIGATVDWAFVTGQPTTIAGYGITDAFDGSYATLTGAPTSITAFGIADGTTGQVLTTDGAGNFSFTTVTSGGGTLTALLDDTSPQLGGTLDANGQNILMGVNTITDAKVGEWNTAYNWGDHSAQGYLTSAPAETFTSLVQDTTPQLGGTLDANSQIIDMGVNTITDAKVGNWDTAYSWGDHSTAGYATGTPTVTLDDVTTNGAITTNSITVGDVTSNGTVSAAAYVNTGAGAPTITSASTITLDAPDGVIVQNGPFRLPSLTTTEKNALTAVNGDMVYDSTLNKAQVYENGAWVSLV